MSVTAYRLANNAYIAEAFDGEGARLYGGRWNSIGTAMVYTAASRSLATLEILVHTEDISVIEGRYSIIPISIPKNVIREVSDADLPEGWWLPQPIAETKIFGDRWVREAQSAVISVPSAVTLGERNYLLNPAHKGFAGIEIGKPELFRLDPRLIG